jgi:uncharacterized membrane protein YgcG
MYENYILEIILLSVFYGFIYRNIKINKNNLINVGLFLFILICLLKILLFLFGTLLPYFLLPYFLLSGDGNIPDISHSEGGSSGGGSSGGGSSGGDPGGSGGDPGGSGGNEPPT